MAQTYKQQKAVELENEKTTQPILTGTFVSVLLLGAFLIVTWISVFGLFVNRANS